MAPAEAPPFAGFVFKLAPAQAAHVNLALIGYRGTGKTTVAAGLAARLGWQWFDLDVELERTASQTIAQIFATEGETAFRERETQTLERFAAQPSCVLATGGGIVLKPRNRELLAGLSAVIWLQAPAHVLWQRIQADTATNERRPNLTASGGLAEVEQLLATRLPLYQQCATLAVDTCDRTPDEVVEAILAGLHLP